jgi:hypothetical protein
MTVPPEPNVQTENTVPELRHATYNDIHNLIKDATKQIAEFKPELLIAIGMILPFIPLFASNHKQLGGGSVNFQSYHFRLRLECIYLAVSFLRVSW